MSKRECASDVLTCEPGIVQLWSAAESVWMRPDRPARIDAILNATRDGAVVNGNALEAKQGLEDWGGLRRFVVTGPLPPADYGQHGRYSVFDSLLTPDAYWALEPYVDVAGPVPLVGLPAIQMSPTSDNMLAAGWAESPVARIAQTVFMRGHHHPPTFGQEHHTKESGMMGWSTDAPADGRETLRGQYLCELGWAIIRGGPTTDAAGTDETVEAAMRVILAEMDKYFYMRGSNYYSRTWSKKDSRWVTTPVSYADIDHQLGKWTIVWVRVHEIFKKVPTTHITFVDKWTQTKPRVVESTGLWPTEELNLHAFNVFRPSPFPSMDGKIMRDDTFIDTIDLLRVWQNAVCSNVDSSMAMLWDLMRYAVEGGERRQQLVLLMGPQGIGKSTFLQFLAGLFDPSMVVDLDRIDNMTNFNKMLEHKLLATIDEVAVSADKKLKEMQVAAINTLVTKSTTIIQAKYQDLRTSDNNLTVVGATNMTMRDLPPAFGGDKRRMFLVCGTSEIDNMKLPWVAEVAARSKENDKPRRDILYMLHSMTRCLNKSAIDAAIGAKGLPLRLYKEKADQAVERCLNKHPALKIFMKMYATSFRVWGPTRSKLEDPKMKKGVPNRAKDRVSYDLYKFLLNGRSEEEVWAAHPDWDDVMISAWPEGKAIDIPAEVFALEMQSKTGHHNSTTGKEAKGVIERWYLSSRENRLFPEEMEELEPKPTLQHPVQYHGEYRGRMIHLQPPQYYLDGILTMLDYDPVKYREVPSNEQQDLNDKFFDMPTDAQVEAEMQRLQDDKSVWIPYEPHQEVRCDLPGASLEVLANAGKLRLGLPDKSGPRYGFDPPPLMNTVAAGQPVVRNRKRKIRVALSADEEDDSVHNRSVSMEEPPAKRPKLVDWREEMAGLHEEEMAYQQQISLGLTGYDSDVTVDEEEQDREAEKHDVHQFGRRPSKMVVVEATEE